MIIKDFLYGSRKHEEIVERLAGRSFTLLERLRMGRIGTGKMRLSMASPKLLECFHPAADAPQVNLSLREKGLLVHLNSGIYSSLWIIPFHHLAIYKSHGWSIYGNGAQLRLIDDGWKYSKFMSNVLERKAVYGNQLVRIEDL